MSLLSDIGSLTGNQSISDFGNTGLGQILSNYGTSQLNKTLNSTPKPAPQVVATAPASTPVSVSNPSQVSKVLLYSGLAFLGLVVVYFLKKRGR